MFLGCGFDCEDCSVQPEGCQCFKDAVQDLITKGVLQFNSIVAETKVGEDEVNVITIHVKSKKIQVPITIPAYVRKSPITITVPEPLPCNSGRAFPWHDGGNCGH